MLTRPCVDCGRPGTNGRCPACRSAYNARRDAARGTPAERGYDAAHRRLRRQWSALVDAGQVRCARCGQPIHPGQAWALDHTDDRTGYLGPSCADCNAIAGGRATGAGSKS